MELSSKTGNAFECEVCGGTATFADGLLYVTYAELSRASDEFDTWSVATNALNPPDKNGVRVISKHLPLPNLAQWRWEHTDCTDDTGSYWIDGSRINTPAKALGWTLHLMRKVDSYTKYSNWEIMLRRLGLVSDG